MVFNATFNNISVILWRSVLLVEETGVTRENHWPVASHRQTLSHNTVSSTPRHERGSNEQPILCDIGNSGPRLVQAQWYGGVKQAIGIPTVPLW
jgi:hypothetical protein